MAVAVGDIITAAQYNTLQGRIANIMGTGSGQDGYGQALLSASVTPPTNAGAGDGDTVEAAFMQNLYDDMNKAYTHQTGNDISAILYKVSGETAPGAGDGNVIGADQTGEDLTYAINGTYTFDQADPATAVKGGFNDYESAMTTIESAKFAIAGSQQTVANVTSNTKTATWNGSIDMEFTCTFTSANHRRHFFNSGGEIRITGSMASPSGAKEVDWNSMLVNTGAIRFGYNYTTASSGTGSSIGGNNATSDSPKLTSAYQTIFTKTGSGVYVENRYRVEAKENSSSVIQFRVTLADNDAGDRPVPSPPPPYGPLVDENITADITLTLGTRRASGSNVSVNNPSFSVINGL